MTAHRRKDDPKDLNFYTHYRKSDGLQMRHGGPVPAPTAPTANDMQVGGDHYKSAIQHWDFALSNNFDYFQGQITKYVTRWKKKGGIKDLKKARHFLDKYIEWAESKEIAGEPGPEYVNQDR